MRLQNVYYVVPDMASAVHFYDRVLGLTLKFRDGDKWAPFDAGGANFSLSSPDEAAEGATGATVVFQVEDADIVAAAIVEAGGAVLHRRDMGSHGVTVACRDPFGNVIQLFERAPA